MAAPALKDDPQTLQRLDALACLFAWLRSTPAAERRRLVKSLAEGDEKLEHAVGASLRLLRDSQTPTEDRQQALTSLTDALFSGGAESEVAAAPSSAAEARGDAQAAPGALQSDFARRLRELMEAKAVTQQELADRIGCSQPAISQMLHRRRRPQKMTILKLAEALHVTPQDLWPDIETAEMLDAVASFQQDDYVMTEAEARALGDAAQRNRPLIPVESLPVRRR